MFVLKSCQKINAVNILTSNILTDFNITVRSRGPYCDILNPRGSLFSLDNNASDKVAYDKLRAGERTPCTTTVLISYRDFRTLLLPRKLVAVYSFEIHILQT